MVEEEFEIDLSKDIDFEVIGDIKPTVREVIGFYNTYMTDDCDVHLDGTPGISLPAYWPYLTYWAFYKNKKSKELIKTLLDKKLIKFYRYH